MDFINRKLARLNNPISPQKAKRTEEKQARRKSSSNPSRTCTYCKKRELPNPRADQKLKRCARCRSALYCSRACQRADWKRGHQRTCSVGAIMVGNSYLDSLSTENMAMDQLIDAYQLRVEDERMYCGRLRGRYTANNPDDDSSQALQYAFQDFRDFLDLAECVDSRSNNHEEYEVSSSSPSSSTTHDNDTDTNSASSPTPSSSSSLSTTTRNKQSILPRWWNAEKRAYCEQRALNQTADQNTWSNLLRPAGKDDILERYQDQSMPMKLRMLAERVYGSDVMGGQAH